MAIARVIIADDHPLMREALRNCLRKRKGIEVVGEAENGKEVVAMCSALRPDVVILDEQMPELEGSEAMRRIKQHSPGTLVVGISMDQQSCEKMRAAGADHFFEKPVPLERLCDLIQPRGGDAAIGRGIIPIWIA
jgi:two-component system response regulator AlgR